MIISAALLGQTADPQLEIVASQKRTDEGIELHMALTNVSSKPVRVVVDHLQ